MISLVMPAILMSICSEVMPSAVPATLKSMSPRWSSSPRMSESTAKPSSSRIRPMAMPLTGFFSGTPASISASDEPQTRRHRRRAVRLQDLRDDAQRVGELLDARQQRTDRPPGQLAVADVAAARRAHAARLPDRERREVVVQHEGLVVLAVERIDQLLVVAGAERGDHQGLGLAAREERRAVGARQHADFRNDRPHLVDRHARRCARRSRDVAAHDVGFQLLEDVAELDRVDAGRIGVRLADRGQRLLARGFDGVVTLALADDLEGFGEVGADQLLGLRLHRVGVVDARSRTAPWRSARPAR